MPLTTNKVHLTYVHLFNIFIDLLIYPLYFNPTAQHPTQLTQFCSHDNRTTVCHFYVTFIVFIIAMHHHTSLFYVIVLIHFRDFNYFLWVYAKFLSNKDTHYRSA